MQPNRLINLLMNLPPAFDVVRCKPATHTFGLQVSIQPVCKLLVFGRVADEAGVELNSSSDGFDVADEVVRHATTAQEDFGNLAFRSVNGVDSDRRWSIVANGFEAFGRAEIDVRYISLIHPSRAELSPIEVCSGEFCPKEGCFA